MKIHELKKHCKLMSLIAVLALSGCASKASDNAVLPESETLESKTPESKTSESETQKSETQEETNAAALQETDNSNQYTKQTTLSPFYGIWCGASKSESEANRIVSALNQKGFDGQVFVTSDWSNLNSEKWYVVTAGIYDSKEAANTALTDVQTFYDSAYVKYSGDYIGNEMNTMDYTLSPFYGIWCGASKSESEANRIVSALNQKGFDGQVFVTSDWSNLNSEKWYVVTAGIYDSKETANAALADVQTFYDSAYVKYSGDYIGNEMNTMDYTLSPFYGIWCGASKSESEANRIVSALNQKGFDGQVFVTSDWSNLNSEKWYVVTAGIYDSKEAANAALADVQTVYDSAYVKYSGDYIGNETAAANTSSSVLGKYAGDYYAGNYFYRTITVTRCDNGIIEGTYYSESRTSENTPVLITDQYNFSVSINADNCFEIPDRGEWYFTKWRDIPAIAPWGHNASDYGDSMEGDGPFIFYKID